jgi:3'-phosphoadenosine 5'-phosphosulfate (PAPS) 3'-phosphatase
MIEILLDYITKKLNITDEELKQLAEEAKQKIIEMQKALVETAADEDNKIIEVADRLTLN